MSSPLGLAVMGESGTSHLQRVTAARDVITAQRVFQPQIGIVLGSGLGELAAEVEHSTSIPYTDIPYFPRTHAQGHAGRLVLGFLAGLPVVICQGRAHRYEGCANSDSAFAVHCMQSLGTEMLITTNAAGGLNSRFQTGDLMVIDSHIDLLWNRGTVTPKNVPALDTRIPVHRGSSPYSYSLIRQVRAIARRQDTVLHQGCYLATLGPTYETRSEYRMFRGMGADAVGMSTIPEVLAAREHSMSVLGFSVITNVASTDIPQSTSHTEVVDAGNQAGPRLMLIIRQLLENLAGQPD